MSKTDDISTKMKKLTEYVEWFEGEDFTLEQSLDKYTEAQKLATEIQADLDAFKNKITVVKKQFDKE